MADLGAADEEAGWFAYDKSTARIVDETLVFDITKTNLTKAEAMGEALKTNITMAKITEKDDTEDEGGDA